MFAQVRAHQRLRILSVYACTGAHAGALAGVCVRACAYIYNCMYDYCIILLYAGVVCEYTCVYVRACEHTCVLVCRRMCVR